MQYRQDNSQRQTQSQKIAPHLIQANTLLQCSNMELLQVIEQEQRENPALDGMDEGMEAGAGCRDCPSGGNPPCARCPFRRESHPLDDGERTGEFDRDMPSADGHAALASGGNDSSEDDRQAAVAESELSRIVSDGGFTASQAADDGFEPLLLARAQITLADQLLSHLRASSATTEDALVAEYLVDCLDERGFLQINEDEACAVMQITPALLQEGIARLQASDPPGIGARNLRECLILQLAHLKEQGADEKFDPIAEALVCNHWDALVQRRHAHLARRLKVSPARLDEALAFIQDRLTPHPAAQFRQPWDHRPDTQSAAVRPDVLIKRTLAGFEVEVLGFDNVALHINPHYRELYDAIRTARVSGAPAKMGKARLTPDHEKHVVAYVERANLFLKNLQQRRRTIQKIALALIETQQGFLDTGQRAFLRPLTRTKLAQSVGMHESTISRALLHKFVQLPQGEVVPFDIFFENAATTKDAVAALIAEENPDAPISDQAITDLLSARGLSIARRTVVKYREELRIPASYLRRRR